MLLTLCHANHSDLSNSVAQHTVFPPSQAKIADDGFCKFSTRNYVTFYVSLCVLTNVQQDFTYVNGFLALSSECVAKVFISALQIPLAYATRQLSYVSSIRPKCHPRHITQRAQMICHVFGQVVCEAAVRTTCKVPSVWSQCERRWT